MLQPPFDKDKFAKDDKVYLFDTTKRQISLGVVHGHSGYTFQTSGAGAYFYNYDNGIADSTAWVALTIHPKTPHTTSEELLKLLESSAPGSSFYDQVGGLWVKNSNQDKLGHILLTKTKCPLGLHDKYPERFFSLATGQGLSTRGHYAGLAETVTLIMPANALENIQALAPDFVLEDKDLNTPVSDLPPPPKPVVIDEHLLDQAEKALKGFGLSVRDIVKAANTNCDIALAYVKAYQNGVEIPPVTGDALRIEPSYFKRLLRSLEAGRTVMLVGPAGCGKTFTALWAAEILGLKPYEMDITDATTPEQLWGRIGLTAEGDIFRPGIIPQAMDDSTSMLIFNEWDACNERVAMTMQSFFERRSPRSGSVPDSEERRFIAKGKLPIVLTANTLGYGPSRKYTGRNRLDAATSDRVSIIQCGYENESLIVVAKGFAKRTADRVVEWASKARLVIEKHDMALDLSTRRLIDIAEAMDKFRLTLKDAIREEFLERLDDSDRKLIEKEAL